MVYPSATPHHGKPVSPLYPLLVVISVVCAVLPMVCLLGLVWWLDRYDREPIWLVGLTFAWGALGATLLSLVGNTTAQFGLTSVLGQASASTLTPVIVAPLVEEPTKALVLLLLLMSRHFDNTTDGFVYGAAAGLGFGMTENLLYFWQVASLTSWDAGEGFRAWASTVALRTCYSAMLHASATAMVGASLGLVRFRSWPQRVVVVPFGFALAMGMHGLWNGLITADQAGLGGDSTLTSLDLALFPVEVLAIFAVFQLALWAERRDIQRELLGEARRGAIPEEHVMHLAHYLRRSRGDWSPPGVPRAAYVRTATRLAFRLRQHRLRPDDSFYQEEVERLRREVRGLLNAPAQR